MPALVNRQPEPLDVPDTDLCPACRHVLPHSLTEHAAMVAMQRDRIAAGHVDPRLFQTGPFDPRRANQ